MNEEKQDVSLSGSIWVAKLSLERISQQIAGLATAQGILVTAPAEDIEGLCGSLEGLIDAVGVDVARVAADLEKIHELAADYTKTE